MSNDTAWQCFSVDEFISQCNWNNVLPQASVHSATKSRFLASWQCLIAQDFFALNNWSGQVIFANTFEQHEVTKQTVSYDVTLALSQFWQCFDWSGKSPNYTVTKADRAIENAVEVIVAVEEFTLNDLSQLF